MTTTKAITTNPGTDMSSFLPTNGMKLNSFGTISADGGDLVFEGFSIKGDGYFCAEETLIRLVIAKLMDELESFRKDTSSSQRID